MKAQYTNLYVKNIPLELSEEDFLALFEKYGKVTSAVLQKDEEGKSKGFGFVNYAGHEEAAKAVEDLHDQDFKGNKLYVQRAQKKGERQEELKKTYEQAKMENLSKYQGVNVYVKNIDDEYDDDKLRAEFEAFGNITSCKIMRDEKGTSKGFGFVCFEMPDEATKAISELNGKMLGSKPLYVSLAQRKEQRRQQLESQIAQRNHLRLQQAAASGMPVPGYMGGPQMYYPGPQGYAPPPPGARPGMGYPQPGMMPPRPRYAPPGQQLPGMPLPAPYGQVPPPQGYNGVPPPQGYPRPPNGAAPPPGQPRGGPAAAPAGAPPAGGRPAPAAPAPNGAVPPPTGGRPLPAGAPAGSARAPAGRAPRPTGPNVPLVEGSGLTAAALAAASPMEQKQMLGEVIYIKIFAVHPELAGKITGKLRCVAV